MKLMQIYLAVNPNDQRISYCSRGDKSCERIKRSNCFDKLNRQPFVGMHNNNFPLWFFNYLKQASPTILSFSM